MNQENGSVFFYILLGVVLLAALGYALSQGGSVKNISDEKADLLATEIINQSNLVREAITKIRLKSFNKNQIDFTNTTEAYPNAGCTTTDCEIFSSDGGGISWQTPPAGANDGKRWGYSGTAKIWNVGGNTDGDLLMFLPNIDDTVCKKINVKLGVVTDMSAAIPNHAATWTADKFAGAYGTDVFGNGAPSSNSFNGRSAFCALIDTLAGTATQGAPLTNSNTFISTVLTNN